MKKTLVFAFALLLVIALIAGCSPKEIAVSDEMAEEEMGEDKMDEEEMVEEEMASGYIDISVADAKAMIDANGDIVIIDVSPKYDEGHLPMAINYYVGDGSLDDAIPSLDMEKTYLVYCHVDSASILGAQKLVDAGFKNVYRLEGNYSAWLDAGYPVEK